MQHINFGSSSKSKRKTGEKVIITDFISALDKGVGKKKQYER